MKKIISVLLALCLCIGLSACAGSNFQEKEMKTDIVGEWIAVNGNAAATFYEDGTGVLEHNGKQNVTWMYNPDSNRYSVAGDGTVQAFVGKEYDMPYMSMMDMDFYHLDDYDNAYTLMLSRRCEDILELTSDMVKISVDETYDLANGMTIQFTAVSVSDTAENDGLQLDYTVMNHRVESVNDPITLDLSAKFYLTEEPKAINMNQSFSLFESMKGESGYSDSIRFSLLAKVEDTVSKYGMVIGALYFEMYGQQYYIDLADCFK